jgi:hypothetical protein
MNEKIMTLHYYHAVSTAEVTMYWTSGQWKGRYLGICLERLMETTDITLAQIQTMYLLSESLSCYCLR